MASPNGANGNNNRLQRIFDRALIVVALGLGTWQLTQVISLRDRTTVLESEVEYINNSRFTGKDGAELELALTIMVRDAYDELLHLKVRLAEMDGKKADRASVPPPEVIRRFEKLENQVEKLKARE